jgi:predicted porin
MQKKILAAAVAGVLAVPAMAVAQSTVQIYGTAQWEHGLVDNGEGRPSTHYQETTGSYIGFRGTENLGGGLTAWFQCETTADIRAFDQVGLCSRNSGLGFRGGFGNVWVGRWHTPMSRAIALGMVGQESTGILGFSYIHGGTGSASIIGTAFEHSAGSATRQRFRRREPCLTTYETPRMGGFMLGAAVSCGNAAADGAAVDGTNNQKPRIWSFAGTFVRGPLSAGLAYERHNDVGTFNSATAPELDDKAWGASAAYTLGPVQAGITFMDRRWETATGDVKKKTWTIGAEWTIAGPHELHIAYGWTGDSKGSSLTGISPTAQGGAAAPGSDTGYQAFTIGYQYAFSKRTTAKLGYTRMENDTNTSAIRANNSAVLLSDGQDTANWALVVRHRF